MADSIEVKSAQGRNIEVATNDAVIRARRGFAVPQPFRESQYTASATGAGASAAASYGGSTDAPWGFDTLINVTVPAFVDELFPMYAVIRINFQGPLFGISHKRIPTPATPPFSLVIDNQAFKVPGFPDYSTGRSLTLEDHTSNLIVDGLHNGDHLAELYFTGVVGASSTWRLFGYFLDSSVGNPDIPRADNIVDITVTTTPTQLRQILNSGTARKYHFLRGLHFYNPDTVARTVLIQNNTAVVVHKISLAAGGVGSWMPPGPVTGATSYTVLTGEAKTTSDVQMIAFVG